MADSTKSFFDMFKDGPVSSPNVADMFGPSQEEIVRKKVVKDWAAKEKALGGVSEYAPQEGQVEPGQEDAYWESRARLAGVGETVPGTDVIRAEPEKVFNEPPTRQIGRAHV